MSTKVLWATAFLLLGLAGFQLYGHKRQASIDLLLPGERMRTKMLDDFGLTASRGDGKGCFTAWVMDPHCPGCKRLAGEIVKQTSRRPDLYYLFVGTEASVDSFVDQYKIPTRQVVRMRSRDDERNLLRFGITATPTRIISTRSDFLVSHVQVMNDRLVAQPVPAQIGACRAL